MLLALSACATIETSTPTQQASEATDSVPTVVLDTAQREALLTAIQSLEGRWKDPEIGETVLEVTSGGSVVRETMFPGQPHEMTNMYSLDLNDLCVTHYCGSGNQPHMRATGLQNTPEGQAIDFQPDGVSDLKTPDEMFMGQMKLVLIDPNHFEQHWQAFRGEKLDEPMVFHYERIE